MTLDRQSGSGTMTMRQKITAGVFVIIVLVIIWQVYGLFKGSTPAPSSPTSTAPRTAMSAASPGMPTGQPGMPQPAAVAKPPTEMTPQQIQMIRMQQEAQNQYLSAVNQLQMLKLEKDIAETNKAIMAAKLETVTAEKGIVDLLQPPTPPPTPATYASGLVNPATAGQEQPGSVSSAGVSMEANYTVISVSRLQNRWTAVVGYQGNLYNVQVGDILPPDNSMVISIGKTGVLLEKNGVKKKVSLVPII